MAGNKRLIYHSENVKIKPENFVVLHFSFTWLGIRQGLTVENTVRKYGSSRR